jgi:hypothetical protein
MFALLFDLLEIRLSHLKMMLGNLLEASRVVAVQIVTLFTDALLDSTCRPETFAKSAKLLREAAIKEKTLAQGG